MSGLMPGGLPNEHFKQFELRNLRTDDIPGAKPKSYGGPTQSSGYIAGAPSGNSKARNESEIFKHLQDVRYGAK